MIVRYVHERINQNGSRERLVTEFSKPAILIGRGGDADILLSSRRASPQHARIEWVGDALVISDLGSLTGIRLNSQRVARAHLNDGDRVSIAELEMNVHISGGVIELTASATPTSSESEADQIAAKEKALRVESYLPAMRMLVVSVIVLGIAGFLVYPFGTMDFNSWSSGPVSNSHRIIEADCQKCHAEPFQPVKDEECLTCHQLTSHAKDMHAFTTQHPKLEMRCAECHMEHNGDAGLITKDADFCVGCHADITSLKADTTLLNVPSFETHPEFRVSVRDASGMVSRVAITDTNRAVDSTQIKLNHEVHLKAGLRGRDGPVTLECSSCHRLSKNFALFEPISFERDCRDCHSLGFDERIPDAQVPHGDAEGVYPALFTEYTKLLLLTGADATGVSGRESARVLPGQESQLKTEPADVSVVARSAREAEREMFTKTGCFLCHSYAEKPEQDRTDTNSHYTISEAKIPNVWLPGARFSHGAHEEFSCESCHEKARNSRKTSDLLLPHKQLCQQCHSQEHKAGYVSSGCAECHSYHDPLGIPREKKQSIADYLHSLTR
jgi:predicted CXXCH cytochrome family protein